MEIYDLRTEDLYDPIGIDVKAPAFSWKIKSDARGAAQTAYQVEVRQGGVTVWDSGKVISDRSLYVKYGGEELKASTIYTWHVTVWDGDESAGAAARFETGLMGCDLSVWNGAKWIGSPFEDVNTFDVDEYALSCTYVSDTLRLAVNARDRDNYVLFEIGKERADVYEVSDDAWGGGEPYKKRLASYRVKMGEGKRHCVFLYVKRTRVTLKADGVTAAEGESILPNDTPKAPRKARLMMIGFDARGERTVVERLKIESASDVIREDDFENGAFSELGRYENGAVVVEDDFPLVCPVSGVNVRKVFTSEGKVRSARLYAAARGMYEAYVNGKKVGEDFYKPGFTDYRLRVQYQTFDVTDIIKDGVNSVSAVVGKGHYSGFCGYSGAMVYGRENAFLAKLVVVYENGERLVTVTDGSWQYTDKGALISGDYFDGTTYDARFEYDARDINDARWVRCGVKEQGAVTPTNGSLSGAEFILSAEKGGAARIVNTIKGRFIGESADGHFIYDMGENVVGTARVRFSGARGVCVKVRYGEMLADGKVYVKNLRSAANTDVYTLRGKDDVFVPSFSSHGFRYVEVSGCGEKIGQDVIVSVEALVISNVRAVTGGFECSNPLINRLYKNIINGQRGNSLLVLTDCPQRNERMGWTGDAQVFARTGAYNMDTKAFTEKWLTDLMDAQLMYNKNGAVPDTAPLGGDNRFDGCGGWGDAAVIVPWEMYRAYGDIRIIEKCYGMMKKWVEYQSGADRQNCGEYPCKASEPFLQLKQRRGDHLAFDKSTPSAYAATAYAARSADILSRAASLLGKKDDEIKYRKRFEDVKRAFNEAWVKEDASVAYVGEDEEYYSESSALKPSQTSYALAIDFELIPKDKISGAARYFKDSLERNGGRLSVGFLGISHLAPALSKAGLDAAAFGLLCEEGNPSWLYSVKNGATTVWERWDSYIAETGTFGDDAMNSFNHYAYGSIGEWIMGRVLGIKPIEAGYKRFLLSPVIGGGLKYAKGFHVSPYGKIESEWRVGEDGSVCYECVVPPNTTARLTLPWGGEKELSSGRYEFKK